MFRPPILNATFFLLALFAYLNLQANDCSRLFGSNLDLVMTVLPRPFSRVMQTEIPPKKWFDGEAALADFGAEQTVAEREWRAAMQIRNEFIFEASDDLGSDWFKQALSVKTSVIQSNGLLLLSEREMHLLEKMLSYDMATFAWMAAEKSWLRARTREIEYRLERDSWLANLHEARAAVGGRKFLFVKDPWERLSAAEIKILKERLEPIKADLEDLASDISAINLELRLIQHEGGKLSSKVNEILRVFFKHYQDFL